VLLRLFVIYFICVSSVGLNIRYIPFIYKTVTNVHHPFLDCNVGYLAFEQKCCTSSLISETL
jgi:hypothetical protein